MSGRQAKGSWSMRGCALAAAVLAAIGDEAAAWAQPPRFELIAPAPLTAGPEEVATASVHVLPPGLGNCLPCPPIEVGPNDPGPSHAQCCPDTLPPAPEVQFEVGPAGAGIETNIVGGPTSNSRLDIEFKVTDQATAGSRRVRVTGSAGGQTQTVEVELNVAPFSIRAPREVKLSLGNSRAVGVDLPRLANFTDTIELVARTVPPIPTLSIMPDPKSVTGERTTLHIHAGENTPPGEHPIVLEATSQQADKIRRRARIVAEVRLFSITAAKPVIEIAPGVGGGGTLLVRAAPVFLPRFRRVQLSVLSAPPGLDVKLQPPFAILPPSGFGSARMIFDPLNLGLGDHEVFVRGVLDGFVDEARLVVRVLPQFDPSPPRPNRPPQATPTIH